MAVHCPNCRGTNVEHNSSHHAAHRASHGVHTGLHVLHVPPLIGLMALGCAGVAALFAGPAHTCRSCRHTF